MRISVESTGWLLLHCFQVELEFGNVGFCEGRKTGVPGEKPSEQGREPTKTQPTYRILRIHKVIAKLWWEVRILGTFHYLEPVLVILNNCQ